MNTETKMWCAIALMFVILAIGMANQALAQQQQVRCKNILDGETVQIFNQRNCPSGWYPL